MKFFLRHYWQLWKKKAKKKSTEDLNAIQVYVFKKNDY